MRNLQAPSARRRGAIVPFMALMLVAIMGFVALAVDLGYIAMVHAQLQNAADSASLAGASQLLDKSVLSGSPNQDTAKNNARTQAQSFSHKNYGGGVALTLDANTGNDAGGDIVCGYLANPSDHTQALTFTQFPNAVKVRVHRDGTRNGALSLFFANALGQSNEGMQAKATAVYEGGITGFKIHASGSSTCKLLPYALDINIWNSQIVNGGGSDDFTRNSTTGVVSSGGDGIPECKLFPLTNGGGGGGIQPGNFGTINIGASNNSTAALSRQILNGPNADDLSYYNNGVLQLDPTTNTLNVNGDTGISAGAKDELASIIGQPRVIPLYSSVTGNGNNANYTIVGFAGIVITEVVLTGSLSSKHITIQPCYVIDANALGGGASNSFFVTKPLALVR